MNELAELTSVDRLFNASTTLLTESASINSFRLYPILVCPFGIKSLLIEPSKSAIEVKAFLNASESTGVSFTVLITSLILGTICNSPSNTETKF